MKSTKAISKTPPTNLPRDEYGALHVSQVLSPDQRLQLKELLAIAIKSGAVPAPYITSDKKELECLNLDTFDVLVFRGKVKGLVIQARSFWKNLRKGYTRSQKTYFLVMRSGKKVEVKELENSTCAKRAKSTTALGQLVNHYLGKTTVACKKGAKVAVRTGFKVLAKTADGRLVSAFDGSEYETGTWRMEAAKAGHGGGFYYYCERELAIDATRRGETFAKSVSEGKTLALCTVEYSGKEVAYGNGKLAASRLRIIGELEVVVLGAGE
jgi:hypothetical protein